MNQLGCMMKAISSVISIPSACKLDQGNTKTRFDEHWELACNPLDTRIYFHLTPTPILVLRRDEQPECSSKRVQMLVVTAIMACVGAKVGQRSTTLPKIRFILQGRQNRNNSPPNATHLVAAIIVVFQ